MDIGMGSPSVKVKGKKSGKTYDVSSMDDLIRLVRDGEVDPNLFSLSSRAVGPYEPEWDDFPKPNCRCPKSGYKLTEPFFDVYRGVTEAIREYYKQNDTSRLFLEFLIEGFFDEYERWVDTQPDDFQKEYLEFWHKKDWSRRAEGKAYRLIGQAFLHISWDLPRVVAECFPFGELEKLHIGEGEATEHFRATNGLFLHQLHSGFRKYNVSGMFAAVGNSVGPQSKLLNSVLIWIIAIRMDAWALGCALGKQPDEKRGELLKKQKAAIMLSAAEATKGPFAWLFMPKPTTFACVLIPALYWAERTIFWRDLAIGVVGLILILIFISNLYSNSSGQTLRIAERFAFALHARMSEVIYGPLKSDVREGE